MVVLCVCVATTIGSVLVYFLMFSIYFYFEWIQIYRIYKLSL